MADKFLIAPINTGLQRDVKPWLIPEDAFEELNNAYIFRGRIKNRVGAINVGEFPDPSAYSSRLRVNVGTTDGAGNLAGTVPLGATGIGAVGQMFSVDVESFTVVLVGAAVMITTGAATTHTFNTATGAFDIQGAAIATDVYYYPALPVMGFVSYEREEINDELTYAFDTRFAYQLTATGWERLNVEAAPGDADWAGTDSEFFWSTTWRGTNDYSYTLFTTNYNAAERLRYFDGTTWTSWRPQYASNANETIESARIIIQFRNRLLLLNTVERNAAGNPFTFVNRCRYSRVGDPIAASSYREDTGGQGSFIDAPTREAIVSAAKLKNRLIVYFERSTYELVSTGNEIYPFVWQQINSTLGCESTFSVVPFDKSVLGIGQTGIHACTGANVQRIDASIPDEIFEIHNSNDGVYRVHGIRDYYNEMVYWTMPKSANFNVYPNRILAFNYKNGSWAFFDDSITAFGYHQLDASLTWQDIPDMWRDYGDQWNDATLEDKFRYVIAGNQQGYTFVMHREFNTNAISQQITNITEAAGVVTITSINHNLSSGDWVWIVLAEGITELNDNNYKVNVTSASTDTFTIDSPPAVTGTYTGNGVMLLVSKIDIKTKQFNFYVNRGVNTYMPKADFYVGKTEDGEITIDYFASSSNIQLAEAGLATGARLGSDLLETTAYTTLEGTQDRFWHAVYLQAQGECIQLRIYWDDEQMQDNAIPFTGLEIHGILFHAVPTQEL